MAKQDWKDNLRSCFESIEILDRCRRETAENFKQFCEFIAEPAFEALATELKGYEIKTRHRIRKGGAIGLTIFFRTSRVDHFQYAILLPKNSVEMRLRLRLRGRKTPKTPLQEKIEAFLPGVLPDQVMKISKEDLIKDIISRYRDFAYESLTSPE
jgi:hypothetical protein